jgi:hypothetical protein
MSDQIEAWGRLGVWSRSVGARTPPSPSLPPAGPARASAVAAAAAPSPLREPLHNHLYSLRR